MSGDQQAVDQDGLVYMVTGVDENGDAHIFVTSDSRRAKSHCQEAKTMLTDVNANWLDD